MSNYQKSIYILNKFSQNIVYRFGDKVKEVTLDDFLRDNPSFTKEDFDSYKKFQMKCFMMKTILIIIFIKRNFLSTRWMKVNLQEWKVD